MCWAWIFLGGNARNIVMLLWAIKRGQGTGCFHAREWTKVSQHKAVWVRAPVLGIAHGSQAFFFCKKTTSMLIFQNCNGQDSGHFSI